MFDYYFTYWDDLPEDSGFSLYSMPHIIWLIVIGAGIYFGVNLYIGERADRKKQRYIYAGIIMIMEAYKYIILAVTGNIGFQHLPLHLCGLAAIIEVIYLIYPCSFLGELMCIVAMPGALAALLFPNWLRYPVINFMSIHSFIIHGILVMLPVMMMLSGEYAPKIVHIYKILIFFAVVVPLIYFINIWQGTNFMFLSNPSGNSPFEGIYEKYGYGIYLLVYGIIVIVIILCMYAVAGLIKRVRKIDETDTLFS